MKKSYYIILLFLAFCLLFSPVIIVAQEKQKESTVESIVVDENGNPIKDAIVFGNEGSVITETDAFGKFTIVFPEGSDLLIEAHGFEPRLIKAQEYKNVAKLQLTRSTFLYGTKDDVNIAFGKIKKGNVIGDVSTINPDEIKGFDNTQMLSSALVGRVPGLLGSSNIRGLGNALFIVDGVPRDISTINFTEVEQISVLKDVNSSILYGNAAVNGVVLIKTKRGQAYKKQINVTGHYGIATPLAMPEYLNSAEYMKLYNEARVNDGLSALYDEAAISNYTSGNKYRFPSVDYYSNEYLKSYKPFFNLGTELSGGSDVATYYTYLGWNQTGSLLDFGTGKTAKENRFNARGNVDLKINSWIRGSLDAVAVLNNNKGPLGDYWSDASTLRPNLFSPLIPIDLVRPGNNLVSGRKNDVNGEYLLGGTSIYLNNPIANGYSGGVKENIQRTFSFNNRIDFDLDHITKGLAFHTNISFDYFTTYDQTVSNSYSVYEPQWNAASDSITSLVKYGTDTRNGTQVVSNTSFNRRIGFYGMLDYNRTFGVHQINGLLLGYGSNFKPQGEIQGNKNTNLGLRLAYTFKKKYMIDFSSAYVNSIKLAEGSRGAFSPSLGVAWVVSSENFMSSASFVDYLKIRMTAGRINSDAGIDGYYYYDNRYLSSGGYSWFEGSWSTNGTISGNGGNRNLNFEKRDEITLGFESILFNRLLTIDANVFKSSYFDQITRPQTKYPSFYSNFIPYENYDENAYQGAEVGLTFYQKLNDVSIVLGANALYTTSEVKKRDEVYADEYQYRTGRPVDARFGLVAEGLFSDEEDIASHALQAFGDVQPGDIKYVDQNKDGIVDSNDEIQIGRSQSPFSYGLSLKLSYRNFTLFALGNGQVGADSYISGNYYWVDGNDKYSTYVRNRWTNATKETATFPRLSSLSNSNNFRNSTYWLYRNNIFKIRQVQLTYDVPRNVSEKLNMKNLSIYMASSNLLTISKFRDIQNLSIGIEPQYRSFSLGLKTTF